MLALQVDYYSIPSEQIINLSSGLIPNNNEYFSMLEKWDKKLSKSSIEAGIYIEWQNQLFLELNRKFIPEKVDKYIDMQLFKVIEKISEMSINEKKELLNKTFNLSLIHI